MPALPRREEGFHLGKTSLRIAPTGEAPTARNTEPLVDGYQVRRGHIGGGDDDVAVPAPHVMPGAIVEKRQLPGMNAHHAVNPPDRLVPLGKRKLHLIEGRQVELIPAPALRLENSKEAGILQVPYGFRVRLPTASLSMNDSAGSFTDRHSCSNRS